MPIPIFGSCAYEIYRYDYKHSTLIIVASDQFIHNHELDLVNDAIFSALVDGTLGNSFLLFLTRS